MSSEAEITLFGLMAIAQEHQKLAERAATEAKANAEALAAVVRDLPARADVAAQEAARATLGALVGEMQRSADDARQSLAQAAKETRATAAASVAEMQAAGKGAQQTLGQAAADVVAAVRGVSWAWLLCAFGLGLGLGVLGGVFVSAKQLDRIEAAAFATWKQTPEGQKAAAGR